MFKVKEIMQKAFWDLLEQQLAADPPQYTQVDIKYIVCSCLTLSGRLLSNCVVLQIYFVLRQALTLLTEIKSMLYSILLPQVIFAQFMLQNRKLDLAWRPEHSIIIDFFSMRS